MVTVWTKDNCQQCKMTKKRLEAGSIPFSEINIDKNPDEIMVLKEMGFMALPVVKFNEDCWSGFRPDLIAKIAI